MTVLTGVMVNRILFERHRATGVEFFFQGRLVRITASLDVVLSLGAIQTPKMLMQSGIGDEVELGKFDIPWSRNFLGSGGIFTTTLP